MTPTPYALTDRICIRVPRPLLEILARECHRSARTTSDIVRQSLVEHLSPREPTR